MMRQINVGRKKVIGLLQNHAESLADLLQQRPNIVDLQLAMARSHVRQGNEKRSRQQFDQALTELNRASEIFTGLLDRKSNPEWTVLEPVEMKSSGEATLTLQKDGTILASGRNPEYDTYSLTMDAAAGTITALRLEAIPNPSAPGGGVGRGPGGSVAITNISMELLTVSDGSDLDIPFAAAGSDIGDPAHVLDGLNASFWGVYPDYAKPHQLVLQLKEPLILTEKTRVGIQLEFLDPTYRTHGLSQFRLSATDAPVTDHDLHLLALKTDELASLDVSFGQVLVQQQKHIEAAAAYTRALERASDDDDRRKLIDQFKEHLRALTIIAEQRPDDLQIQLAVAQKRASNGKTALENENLQNALTQLRTAREIFAKLQAEHRPVQWAVVQPANMISQSGAELTLRADGSVLVDPENTDTDTYTLTLDSLPETITAVRLEALTDPTLPGEGPGLNSNGNFVLSRINVLEGDNDVPLQWAVAFADHSQPRWDVAGAVDSSEQSGWAILDANNRNPGVDRFAVFALQQPWNPDGQSDARIQLEFQSLIQRHSLGHFRLSVTSDPNAIKAARFQQELKASGLAELETSLGKVHGQQGRIDEAATAFSQALDLTTEVESRTKILQDASAFEGVLDKLTELRPEDSEYHDGLARHFQQAGDLKNARAAAATARTLYEQQLKAAPENSDVAKALANLFIELHSAQTEVLQPTDMRSEGDAIFTPQKDGSVLVSGPHVSSDVYTITAKADSEVINAVRLEVLPDPSLPNSGPGRHASGNFQLQDFQAFVTEPGSKSPPVPVALKNAVASFAYAGNDVDIQATINEASDKVWHVWGQTGKRHYADYELAAPLKLTPGQQLTVVLRHRDDHNGINLGRFRLSVTGAADLHSPLLAAKKIKAVWPRLAAAYHALGDGDKALELFTRSIELASADQARAAVAQQAAAFEDVFAELLEQFPGDKALRLGQAKYLAAKHTQESEFDQVTDVLSAIMEDFPDDIELLNQRADAFTKQFAWQAADADYAQVIALEADDGRRRAAERNRAAVQLRLGQFQNATDILLQESMLSPGNVYYLRDACSAQMSAGNLRIAKTIAARFYDKFKGTKDAGHAQRLLRTQIAQPGLVNTQIRRELLALASTAGGDTTERMTAAIHYRLGDLEKAEPLLKSSGPQFHALAAMLLYDQGHVEQARTSLKSKVTEWFERERQKDPDSAIPAQQRWQDWGAKIALWREATRKLIGPRIVELDAEVYGGVTVEIVSASYGINTQQKDVTETLRKHFAESGTLSWHPDYRPVFGDPAPGKYKNITIKYRLNDLEAELILQQDKPIDFLEIAEGLLTQGPTNSVALLERAGLLADAGLHEEAREDLEQLASLNFNSPEVHALHGRVLAGLKRNEEALSYLNQAIEAGTSNGDIYATRGNILLQLGQTDTARADLEKSLQLKPTERAAGSLADLLLAEAENVVEWIALKPAEMKSEGGATLTLLDDNSVLSSGEHPDRDVYTVTVPVDVDSITSLALELLPHESLPKGSVGRGVSGQGIVTEVEVVATDKSGNQHPVVLTDTVVDYAQVVDGGMVLDGRHVIDGDAEQDFHGWGVHPQLKQRHVLVLNPEQPISADTKALTFTIRQNHFNEAHPQGLLLGRFRLSASSQPGAFQHEASRFAATKTQQAFLRLAAASALTGSDLDLAALTAGQPALATSIAQALLSQKKWKQAIVLLDQALADESPKANRLASRAEALGKLQQWETADADWERAFTLQPQNEKLRQRWLDSLSDGERWPQIAGYYSALLDDMEEGTASYAPRYKLVQEIIRRGDGVFAALQTERSQDGLMQLSLARDAVLQDDWETAVATYSKQFQPVTAPEDGFELAAALLLANRTDDYKTWVKRVAEDVGDSISNDDTLGFVMGRMASLSAEAVVPWSDVVAWAEPAALDGGAGWHVHAAAMANLRAGNLDRAQEWLLKSNATGWHRGISGLDFCLLNIAQGDIDAARRHLQRSLKWRADREVAKQDGYWGQQAIDWLEFSVLLKECETLLNAESDSEEVRPDDNEN